MTSDVVLQPPVASASPTQPMPCSRGTTKPLLLLVLLAFAIRTAYALAPHVAFGDESCYVWLAQNLFSGQGYSYYQNQPELHFPPLYPIVLGALSWVVSDWEALTRVAYVLFGGLLPIPIFTLGRSMYSSRVGFLAALLVAVAPAFTSGVLFAETMSEPLYLLCMFSGLALVYEGAMQKKLLHAALAGAALALANLTRSEGQVYFLVGFVFLCCTAVFVRPRSWLRGAGLLLAYTAVFLALSFPYALYLHAHTGRWELDTKSTTSYTTTRSLVTKDGTGFQRDTWGLNDKGEIHYYAHDFDASLYELLKGKYRDRVWTDVKANFATARASFLHPQVLGRWLLLLSGIGLVGAVVVHRRPGAELLNFMILGTLAAVLVFFVTERFLYGLLLPLFLWAAVGLDTIDRLAKKAIAARSRSLELARSLGLTALLAVFVAYTTHQGLLYWKRRYPEQGEVFAAARWLRDNTPKDAVVMSTNTEVAFQAGRKWLPAPFASRDEVVKYGLKRGATHLLLRGRYLERRPEQNVELFNEARDYEGLTLLAKSGMKDGEPKFVVYALKSAAQNPR